MATISDNVLFWFLIIQMFGVGQCQAYSYSYSWWSMWYFWVIIFGVMACCFGACGSYYRRRMLMRQNQGVPPLHPGQPGYTIHGYNSTMTSPGVVVGSYPSQAYNPQSAVPQGPYNPASQAQYNPAFSGAAPLPPVQFMPPPGYSQTTGPQMGYTNTGGDSKDNYTAPPPAYTEICGPDKASANTGSSEK